MNTKQSRFGTASLSDGITRREAVLGGTGGLVLAARISVPVVGAKGELMTASGAGVNLKLMPDPDGNPVVPMRESFAFTVFFDPKDAPVNHGIFGPKFTFTGEMIAGKVTIGPPIGVEPTEATPTADVCPGRGSFY